jgi:riboflavin synthase
LTPDTRFSGRLILYTVEVSPRGDYGVGDNVTIEVDPTARSAARLFETLGDFRNKD